MTFLELCQMTARESGTVSGVLPLTVTGQTDYLLKIVKWTNDAYYKIQTARLNWSWMRREFTSPDIIAVAPPAQARYTPAAWNLTRFSRWQKDDLTLSPQYFPMTVYKKSLGVSDEGFIRFVPWEEFRTAYFRGAQTANRPQNWSISPAGEMCLGPAPDSIYIMKGEFSLGPQTLAADGDIPEMPERFHRAIAWLAVDLLNSNDEASQEAIVNAMRRATQYTDDLERDQLSDVTIGNGPIA